MSICLSHGSSLEHWDREALGEASWGSVPECAEMPSLTSALSCADEARPLGAAPVDQDLLDAAETRFRCSTRPFDVLVERPDDRRHTKLKRCHVWGSPLPPNSLVGLGGGAFACTPAFCFLQLAGALELVDLVRLGYELCGVYSREDPARCHAQLVSTQELAAYLNRAKGAPGQEKALRALRFVADRSGSPMETAVAMLLCLSPALGGYGLPLPEMNRHVGGFSRDPITGFSSYFCDLYWPAARLDVEYDSDLFHSGAEQNLKDSVRRNALQDGGVRVITITTRQLENREGFDTVARQIARALGHRLRFGRRAYSWEVRSGVLHSDLLAPHFGFQGPLSWGKRHDRSR